MKKDQINKLRMFKVVLAVCLANPVIIATVAAFQEVMNTLGNIVAEIERLQALQTTDNTGVAKDSNQVKTQLADAILAVSGALHAFAADNGNNTLMEKVHFTPSHFGRFTQSQCIAAGTTVLTEARAYTAELTRNYLTAEKIDQLEALVNDYRNTYTKTREVKVSRAAVTVSLKNNISEGMTLLKGRADKLAVQFKDTYPDFYSEYRQARVIEDIGIRHEPTEEPASGDV